VTQADSIKTADTTASIENFIIFPFYYKLIDENGGRSDSQI